MPRIFLMIYEKEAEREGFEPPEVLPSSVFKTGALNRSAISPLTFCLCFRRCKSRTFCVITKIFLCFFDKKNQYFYNILFISVLF